MKQVGYFKKLAFSANLLLAAIANAYAAGPSYNIQLGVASENFEGTSESFNQLTAAVKYSQGLTRHSGVNLNADIFTRKSADSSTNDSNGILAEVIYSYIPQNGFSKPVYSIALRQQQSYSDHQEKNYAKTSLILADTIRLDDQLTLTGGLELTKQSFDNDDRTIVGLFINTDFQTTESLIIYFNIKFQDEQSDSSASVAVSEVGRTAARNDIAGGHLDTEPPHTDPSLPSTNSNMTVSDTKNSLVVIGSNYKISANHSFDISYEHVNYKFSDSNDIDANIISLDYFYKF